MHGGIVVEHQVDNAIVITVNNAEFLMLSIIDMTLAVERNPKSPFHLSVPLGSSSLGVCTLPYREGGLYDDPRHELNYLARYYSPKRPTPCRSSTFSSCFVSKAARQTANSSGS